MELRAHVGDPQVPREPVALPGVLGDAEQRRALAHGERAEQRQPVGPEVPAVRPLHVPDHAGAGSAEAERAVDEGERGGVLGQLLGEPRLLVEHQPIERRDEVGGRLGLRGQLRAEMQHGAADGDRAVGGLAARLQVAPADAQHALIVGDVRSSPLAAHDADGVRAEEAEGHAPVAGVVDRVRLDAAHAVHDLDGGDRGCVGAHGAPRALDGGVDERRAVVGGSVRLGFDAGAVLGGPGDEAKRHRCDGASGGECRLAQRSIRQYMRTTHEIGLRRMPLAPPRRRLDA